MVRKFESNQPTKNDINIHMVNLLNKYSDLPIKQVKRYDGGFSIILDDDTVYDVIINKGEPYYY